MNSIKNFVKNSLLVMTWTFVSFTIGVSCTKWYYENTDYISAEEILRNRHRHGLDKDICVCRRCTKK